MLSSWGTQGKDRKVCVFSYQILLAQSWVTEKSQPLSGEWHPSLQLTDICSPRAAIWSPAFFYLLWDLDEGHMIMAHFLMRKWSSSYGGGEVSNEKESVGASTSTLYSEHKNIKVSFSFNCPLDFSIHLITFYTFFVFYTKNNWNNFCGSLYKLKRRIHSKYSLSLAWGLLLRKDNWT